MFKILLGEVKTGHLKRLPYLGYTVLLQLLFFGSILAIGVAIGTGEQLIGGDVQQAQQLLREWFSLPFIIIFGLFLLIISFAGLNLVAKRIRDTGLPGWWTLLVVLVLEVLVSVFLSQKISASLHMFFVFTLLFIPTNTFFKMGFKL